MVARRSGVESSRISPSIWPDREIWRSEMRNVARAILWVFLAFICVTASHVVGNSQVAAQGGPALQVDKASIGGTVMNAGTGKPEAGVWVIAETKLGVPYRK